MFSDNMLDSNLQTWDFCVYDLQKYASTMRICPTPQIFNPPI